jgi:hypothetical protein
MTSPAAGDTTAPPTGQAATGTTAEPPSFRHIIGSKDKRALYYDPPLDKVSPAIRELLEGYGGMDTTDVLPRILEAVRGHRGSQSG